MDFLYQIAMSLRRRSKRDQRINDSNKQFQMEDRVGSFLHQRVNPLPFYKQEKLAMSRTSCNSRVEE